MEEFERYPNMKSSIFGIWTWFVPYDNDVTRAKIDAKIAANTDAETQEPLKFDYMGGGAIPPIRLTFVPDSSSESESDSDDDSCNDMIFSDEEEVNRAISIIKSMINHDTSCSDTLFSDTATASAVDDPYAERRERQEVNNAIAKIQSMLNHDASINIQKVVRGRLVRKRITYATDVDEID
tara:strand:+ start:312 stop:854 length:543 start_codon:yes stop_codon:yes gene_type:complete